jgi:hypothetical protein
MSGGLSTTRRVLDLRGRLIAICLLPGYLRQMQFTAEARAAYEDFQQRLLFEHALPITGTPGSPQCGLL